MSSRTRVLAVLLLAPLLAATAAGALPPPWVPLGPFGGDVRSLTAGPEPGTLYAVTPGGAFKTADRGLSWAAVNPRGDAGSLAADPAHPGVLYLSVQMEGVIKSTDGGAHWAPDNGGLPFQSATPRAVALDPARPERLYLITSSPAGLWRSGDGGASWRSGGPAGPRSIAVSPVAGTAFLSAAGGVYRTLDAGATWKPLGHGLPAGPADALAVSASDPRTVYAYFNAAGLYRSQDGGASWKRQTAPLSGGGLVAFAVSPRTPRLLYLSLANGGFYRSLDGGVLWTGLGGISGVKVIAGAEPRMSGTVYAGLGIGPTGSTLGGVWRSEDAGTTWTQRNQGLSGVPVTDVAVDPSQPDHLWAAVEGRVYRSFNRGAQWLAASPLPAGNPPAANAVRRLAVGASSQVFAADLRALWRSADDGASWTLAFAPPGIGGIASFVELIAAASPPSAGLYLEAHSGGVYRSTDGGASWQPEGDPGLVCGSGDLAVAPASPEVLYAGGSGKSPAPYLCHDPFSIRVARSDDGGATWTDVSAGLPGEFVSALAVDPRDARIVYAGIGVGVAFPEGDGVWKSTDGGRTWSRAGAELADRTVSALLASTLSGRLYVVIDGNRVFRSDDGGASWQGWSRGLKTSAVFALTADPGNPGRIYAATANGVWALTETD
jgi:photosystem II stability/assembly factor-like uncharacterized protein